MAQDDQQVGALTVKGIRRDVLNAFAGACKIEGKTMASVLEQLMREYAIRTIGSKAALYHRAPKY